MLDTPQCDIAQASDQREGEVNIGRELVKDDFWPKAERLVSGGQKDERTSY